VILEEAAAGESSETEVETGTAAAVARRNTREECLSIVAEPTTAVEAIQKHS
jgi:hypothetical protein